jgi:YgiT-type zinc finger domain-containing protein
MESKWKSCPVCDSSEIKRIKKTLTFHTKHGKVKVPNLLFDECDSCKEQFFDEEANSKIETYVNRSVKVQHIRSH